VDAIQSVLVQTSPVFEIIVINDSNCGETPRNIWGPPVQILQVPSCTTECGGIGVPRQFGVDRVSKRVTHIAFLDDDDVWLPYKMEVQLAAMKNYSVEIISSDALEPRHSRCSDTNIYTSWNLEQTSLYQLWNGGKWKDMLEQKFRGPIPIVLDYKLLNIHNILITSSTVVTKHILTKYRFGLHDGHAAEDIAMWRKIIATRSAVVLPEPLVVFDTMQPTAECIRNSKQPPIAVHFRTYGDANYAAAKRRLVYEAKQTGWFTSVLAQGPKDLPLDFQQKYQDILSLPKGAGYWIWKYSVIEMALEEMNEGDMLVYMDAGCQVNIKGKKRYLEYIQQLKESKYDILTFTMSFHPEHLWTTERVFQAFNLSKTDPIRTSGQHIATIILMKKGKHLRKWLEMVHQILDYDPWLITDKYNAEARSIDPKFNDARHDQSIASVSRKLVGSLVLDDESYPPRQPQYPFWSSRLKRGLPQGLPPSTPVLRPSKKGRPTLKVRLLITTHLPEWHLKFINKCWPKIIATVPLLQQAEVLLYASKEPPKTFVQLFRNITVHQYNNPGYQEGAIQAMVDADKHGWMRGYDWVIRINPDVIIRNDTWLRGMMENPEVDGIFTDCYSRNCHQHCTNNIWHSDFFAFRPHAIPKNAFLETKAHSAEAHAKLVFQKYIAKTGRDRWLKGSKQHGNCRVLHRDIIHDHAYADKC